MKILKIFFLFFIIFGVVVVLFLIYEKYKFAVYVVPQDTFVVINKGAQTTDIAELLKEKKIIPNKIIFILKIKLKNLYLKPGEYFFAKGTDTPTIIRKLLNGEIYRCKITFPEGFTLRQIAQRLQQNNLIENSEYFLLLAKPKNFKVKYIPKNINTLEGFMFPSTYFISRDKSEKEIIFLFLNIFLKQLQKLNIEAVAKKLKLTPYQIIIFASLVEKEAKLDKERSLIASVLYKRLQKKMLLQCDATIQYTLNNHQQNLKFSNLKIKSLYNTYIFKGLPPTPICNPGIKSIKAVLNIKPTPFLYYVAKPDGSHFFSVSFAQHRIAKQKAKILWKQVK